tara:strand:+ start:156 stop:575 length:420 start_codon:yes stop_codon:yes gene_type:complete
MQNTLRTCRCCGVEQPITEFYKTGRKTDKNPDNRHYVCKTCTKTRLKDNHDPEKYRRQHLKRVYGITPEEYAERLEVQDGRCACCGTATPGGKHNMFVVDHCHNGGEVRGLLCHNCNTALGLIRDNSETLAKMISYLAD